MDNNELIKNRRKMDKIGWIVIGYCWLCSGISFFLWHQGKIGISFGIYFIAISFVILALQLLTKKQRKETDEVLARLDVHMKELLKQLPKEKPND
jgi:hypothetical protein